MTGWPRRTLPFSNALATNWPDRLSVWTVLTFGIVYLAAFLPGVVNVVGIHADYDELANKSWGFFHEGVAVGCLASARPICSLLTNIPLLPASELADFRWVRLFSIATVWLLGTQLLIICTSHLAVRPRDALATALAVFLVPAFLYSVLAANAWAPYLMSIFFSLWSYGQLSRSNIQATAFIDLVKRRAFREFIPQALSYLKLRPVVFAIVLTQVALFDYPPQTLILACIPVITLLFSTHPLTYRFVLVARDLIFLGLNVVLYTLVARFLFIPVMRRIIFPMSDSWAQGDLSALDLRIAESYRYALNFDLGEAFRRLGAIARVAGDLWFLPQLHINIAVGALILVVGVIALADRLWRRRDFSDSASYDWGRSAAALLFTVPVCFVLAGSAVLGASGGFVADRTVAMPVAIACIVSLFAVRYLVEFSVTAIGAPANWKVGAGNVAAAGLVAAAAGAMYYSNYLTMRLARNENAYHVAMVKEAEAAGVNAIVVVDPRPFTLPEDHPEIFDQKNRAVPPYGIGCFSGYCLPNDAIFRVVATELGMDGKRMKIWSLKGNDRGAGVTCELLKSPLAIFPAGASKHTVQMIQDIRASRPAACFTYDLAWHDVSIDLSADPRPVRMVRLDNE